MAVMTVEQKDLGKVRSKWGTLWESARIRKAHSKVLDWSLFTVLLPQAILLLVAVFFTYRNLPESFMVLEEAVGGRHDLVLLSYLMKLFGGSPVAALDGVRVLLALAVGTILFQGVLGLSLAGTVHAVRLIYDGQAVSFLDLLRASTPYSWIRLSLTNAYCYVLMFSILLGQAVGVILLIQSKIAIPWLVFGTTVLVGLSLVGYNFLGIILTIASGVAVLDEEYGWAAMHKSLKLLKGNVKVAVLLQLQLSYFGMTDLLFLNVIQSQLIEGDHSPWSLYVIVVYLLWTSYAWQVRALCSGIQYMAFKAYHNEKGSDFLSEKRTKDGINERLMDGKYERLGGVYVVALQGVEQAETVV